MWRIPQQDQAEDFVIATCRTTSLLDFCRMAFREIGVELTFSGQGREEKGVVAHCALPDFQLPIGKTVIAIDPKYYRPAEVDLLIGDASKAKQKLGWEPQHSLETLVQEMMASDLALFRRDTLLQEHGLMARRRESEKARK